ncbi:MAG TPA: bifunctional DNA-binding transcriptional regulator/O6-methylguanine-DNA methyltransferase Ada [Verrucomicrobiae bacterium]|nr:bifunctional DNA-binding transcriptional regulator/O6-methylguanine-DNA methyltransferase Ada [Verrucomicrobiae bacterium]
MKTVELDDQRWQAVQQRDVDADGQFVFAVRSTGIYCRPSCPARRPARDKVVFFPTCDAAEQNGFRACRRCHPRETPAHATMVKRVCQLIETNLEGPLSLAALGEKVRMSPFHLQRIFKRTLGVSPRAYADAYRFRRFKHELKQGPSATNAVYAAGYGSSSRAYERTASRLGMTPTRYRNGGEQTRIHYLITKCALGNMLVAATDKRICMVSFGDNKTSLERALRQEFPAADMVTGGANLKVWTRSIVRHLNGYQPRLDLPFDVRATAFQSRVWTALRSIPYGQTRSYTQIARAVGRPKAVRAVAHACATNPAAVLIPCHRVVRENGALAGYRWGLKRKRRLLAKESSERV